MSQKERNAEKELQEEVPEEDLYLWRNPKIISGELCAVHCFFTTDAIVVGIDAFGYQRRYCYQDRAEADTEIAKYTDTSQHPGGNWIKCKGRFKGEYVDLLNPDWVKS